MMQSLDLAGPYATSVGESLKNYRIGGLIFYARGRRSGDEEQFVSQAVQRFDIKPGYYSFYPWYKRDSALLIVFNGNR